MGRHNVDKSGDPRGSQTVGQRQGSGKQKKQGTARGQGKLDGEEVELLLVRANEISRGLNKMLHRIWVFTHVRVQQNE